VSAPGDVNSPDFWSREYQEGRAGWDLGTPTPAFEDLLRNPQQMPQGSRPFAPGALLVPCSGHGYDALAYARNGFNVTAVDFAPEPLDILDLAAQSEGLDLRIFEGDMFAMGSEFSGAFDYILEYTCLCSLDPARRDEYIQLLYRLLKPGGWVVGLIFPMDGRPGGPPFSIDMDELNALLTGRFRVLDERFHPASIKPRKGKEVFVVWEKVS